jgi:hypothetical protein
VFFQHYKNYPQPSEKDAEKGGQKRSLWGFGGLDFPGVWATANGGLSGGSGRFGKRPPPGDDKSA